MSDSLIPTVTMGHLQASHTLYKISPEKKSTPQGRKQVIQYIYPAKFSICTQLLFVEKTIRKDFPMEKEHQDCKPKELCMRKYRVLSLYRFH